MFFLAFITLVTGTPGAGKTLWVISELVKLFSPSVTFLKQLLIYLKIAEPIEFKEPLIYAHGIPDLKIPHEPVYCQSPLCDVCRSVKFQSDQIYFYVENWYDWCEPGSIIILDEVQRVWRPRASGSVVPLDVANLETHRHKGVDFWLVSQSGKLIDSNVRRLINRHIHLVAGWNGRSQFEWSEYQENTSSTAGASRFPYVLNKKAFEYYKSSSLHTTVTKRKPLALYLTGLAIVLLVALFYSYISKRLKPKPVVEEITVSATKSIVKEEHAITGTIASLDSVYDFKPAVEGRAETAPAYKGLLHPQSFPYPENCQALIKPDFDFKKSSLTGQYSIESFSECECYTDQGTVYDLPLGVCVAYLYGQVYNPYTKHKFTHGVNETSKLVDGVLRLKIWTHSPAQQVIVKNTNQEPAMPD